MHRKVIMRTMMVACCAMVLASAAQVVVHCVKKIRKELEEKANDIPEEGVKEEPKEESQES